MAVTPSYTVYGRYENPNYGVNTLVFSISGMDFYYSYKTLVAFWHPLTGLVASVNYWSRTTGKHLNWIDGGDKAGRLKEDQFGQTLRYILEREGLNA